MPGLLDNANEPAAPMWCTETDTQVYGLTKLEYFMAHAPAVPEWYDSNQKDQSRRAYAWPAHYARCVLISLERERNE